MIVKTRKFITAIADTEVVVRDGSRIILRSKYPSNPLYVVLGDYVNSDRAKEVLENFWEHVRGVYEFPEI
jgi:hypothetical protein